MIALILFLLAFAFAELPEREERSLCETEFKDEFLCITGEFVFDTIDSFAPVAREFVSQKMDHLDESDAEQLVNQLKQETDRVVNHVYLYVYRGFGMMSMTKTRFPENFRHLKSAVLGVVDEFFVLATSPAVKRFMIGAAMNVTHPFDLN